MRRRLTVLTRPSTIAGSDGVRRGVFIRMMEGLSGAQTERRTVMIDATYLKAHRTASSLRVKKGVSGD